MEGMDLHLRFSKEITEKIDRIKRDKKMNSRNEVIKFIVKNYIYEIENPDSKYQKLIEDSNYSINNFAHSMENMNDNFKILISYLED